MSNVEKVPSYFVLDQDFAKSSMPGFKYNVVVKKASYRAHSIILMWRG